MDLCSAWFCPVLHDGPCSADMIREVLESPSRRHGMGQTTILDGALGHRVPTKHAFAFLNLSRFLCRELEALHNKFLNQAKEKMKARGGSQVYHTAQLITVKFTTVF